MRNKDTVFETALFIQRPVTGVENSAGRKLVGQKQVGQQPSSGTVELFDHANQQTPVELIRAARVHDMHRIYALAVIGAIQFSRVVADILIEMRTRLKRE